MIVFHIVHGALSHVLLYFFGNAVSNIGLLQQGVTHILFISQNVMNDSRGPPFYLLRGRNIILFQFLLDLAQTAAG